MKAPCALPLAAMMLGAFGAFAIVQPATAADMPADRAPVVKRIPHAHGRVIVRGCRLGTERLWDGYGWYVRDIQVCR